ncbi:MAG: DUF1702 family protein [Gaiellaceae bacterium]
MATTVTSDGPAGVFRGRRSRVERRLVRFLRIDPSETELARRGFASCPARVRQQLELHGASFVHGYHAALAHGAGDELRAELELVDSAERGFAYEGAAMALALLDLLLRGRRIGAFLAGSADRHVYMVHVGCGWALARLHRRPWGHLPLDPLLRWLALDGYGFHEAYFSTDRVVRERRPPRRLRGGERAVFDQGVGRALWFVCAADAVCIADTISSFEPERRADLWSGVGLAATYAGAVDDVSLRRLATLAGVYRADAAQGAAFAAGARVRAGNVVPHVARGCEALAGAGVTELAELTDRALAEIGPGDSAAHYERWRAAIRSELA